MELSALRLWIYDFGTHDDFFLNLAPEVCSRVELDYAKRCVAKRSREYLIGRVALRLVLSHDFIGRDPKFWSFARTSHSQPYLVGDSRLTQIKFSVSHSDQTLVLGVQEGLGLGLDIEDVRPLADLSSYLKATLATEELQRIESLPEARRLREFYTYWTLKEAYLKGIGLGGAMDMRELQFNHSDNLQRWTLEGPKGREWSFMTTDLRKGQHLAVAIHSGQPGAVALEFHELSELISNRTLISQTDIES
jgi:4'-phosphopantetheinyl transferase